MIRIKKREGFHLIASRPLSLLLHLPETSDGVFHSYQTFRKGFHFDTHKQFKTSLCEELMDIKIPSAKNISDVKGENIIPTGTIYVDWMLLHIESTQEYSPKATFYLIFQDLVFHQMFSITIHPQCEKRSLGL